MNAQQQPRRSLILAGGGLKVAFQAGVLQVWLDEAGIRFDHVDGASGGVFNLAMLCQGMNGSEVADNWRGLPILKGVSPNWLQYFKLYFAESILTYKRWRKNILAKHWGLDWGKIRQSELEATFNLYNFSKHRLEVWEARDISEKALTSAVSLPIWFPPVRLNGDDYIDAVYHTDANLIEAVNRGADELWIIWTVSEKPLWRNGFVHNYFQIIEAAGNGRFRADLDRIRDNNEAIAAGGRGEFGRKISLKVLTAEVPLHYLLNFRSSRFTKAVDLGVEMGREWCKDNDVPLQSQPGQESPRQPIYLEFTEEMKGRVGMGASDFVSGAQADDAVDLSVELTIKMDDVDRFVLEARHQAAAEGTVRCEALGGELPVEMGEFNLFIDTETADTKKMLYRLHFHDGNQNPLSLLGFKRIHDNPGFDLWRDTTLLYTRVVRGHVESVADEQAENVAMGIIRIHGLDFARQMTTFRARGGTAGARLAAMMKFGRFFMGSLWDAYRRWARLDSS